MVPTGFANFSQKEILTRALSAVGVFLNRLRSESQLVEAGYAWNNVH